MSVNQNTNPYYNDYDETKQFEQILYLPGSTLQARELNQMQTYLQKQIERFGSHVFTEGSLVIPGAITFKERQQTVYVTLDNPYAILEARDDLKIESANSGLIAQIVIKRDAEGTDPICFFVEPLDSATNNETTLFVAGDKFNIFEYDPTGNKLIVATGTFTSQQYGQSATIDAGVYFINGAMVQNAKQTVIVSKASLSSNARVGFEYKESVVTPTDDVSLLSNATGEPNYKAEGAHRLKKELILAIKDSIDETDFIELMTIKNGVMTQKIRTAEYSLLQDMMARRTYEESGNYVVSGLNGFPIEHLKEGVSQGFLNSSEGGDPSKIAFGINKGVAYVKGYRVDNQSLSYVVTDKGRDTAVGNNSAIGAAYGNYIIVTSPLGLPSLDRTQRLDLYDGIVVANSATGSVIGDCLCRAIEREPGTVNQYRLYLYDIQINPLNDFNDVKSMRNASGDFVTDVDLNVLFASGRNVSIFQSSYDAIKTLKPTGSTDTNFTVFRTFEAVADAAGTVVFNTAVGESFIDISSNNNFISTNNTIYDSSAVSVLGGTPFGRQMTIILGAPEAGNVVRLVASVYKSVSAEKSKSLSYQIEVLTLTSTNKAPLSKNDIYKITKITDATSGTDVTNDFILDNGQRDNYYDIGSISTKDGSLLTTVLNIEYQYFEHSSGDYFSVDSYAIDYDEIPIYTSSNGTEYRLTNCLDFRPIKNTAGTFTSSTNGEIPKPSSRITFDVEYYLPRIDTVYVNANGIFGVSKGISSQNPSKPLIPNDAMALYDVTIPAYTYSVDDVISAEYDNKRYTMRDIGRLEKRIEKVEYYTALNSLEQSATSISVLDAATGNDRFKNGIATDDFRDFRLSETSHPEWAASIDVENKQLTPTFEEFGNYMFSAGDVSGWGEYIKTYTEVTSVEQPYATSTSNINPYAVFTWTGSILLTPDSDFWVDTVYTNPRIINQTINNRGAAVQGNLRNSWNTQFWMGGSLYNFTATTRTTTTFTSTTTTKQTGDSVVSTSILPYMRSTTIDFKGEGLRPFTKVNPYFSNVDVTSYVQPLYNGVLQASGTNLVTDKNGKIEGRLTLPNSNVLPFTSGVNEFVLTDTMDSTEQTTFASAEHSSGGSLNTRQRSYLRTTTLGVNSSSSTSYVRGSLIRTRPRDPIAQTFRSSGSEGEFLTSVDIAFATKAMTIPVNLEIRTVENGIPTDKIVAGGTAFKYPDDITTSTDGSVYSKFEFETPIYIEGDEEYAIILLADTQEYNVYVADMGGTQINGTATVSKQPHTGVFLSSSNGSTWTPNQTRDLKFRINRASFTTTSEVREWFSISSDARFNNTNFNPMDTTIGSTTIRYNIKSHGLKVGDEFTLIGSVAGNGIVDSELQGSHTVTAVNDNWIEFVVTTPATTTGKMGGIDFPLITNTPYNEFNFTTQTQILSGTNAQFFYRYRDEDTRAIQPWVEFVPGENVIPRTRGVITYDGTKDLEIRVVLTSESDRLSPVVRAWGSGIKLIDNQLSDSSLNEDQSGGGESQFRYVTKDIVTNNPSTLAKLYFNAKCPGDTEFEVYYKIINDADIPVTGNNWIKLEGQPSINDNDAFYEYEYTYESATSFSGIKWKLVFKGTEKVNMPALSDFRSLLLA